MGSEVEGRETAALAAELDLGLAVDPRIPQRGHRHPESLGHFIAESELNPIRHRKDERSDYDEPGERSAGPDVGESAEQGVGGELPADLFESLAPGGVAEMLIGWIETAAGKADVAGPGITFALGPADQQDGIGIGRHDHRDRGPIGGGIERYIQLR